MTNTCSVPILMTPVQALEKAYTALSPLSDKSKWEFESHLTHLEFIVKSVPVSKKIFDAGCGIGILLLALKYMGYQVSGGDKYTFSEEGMFSVDGKTLHEIWKRELLNIVEFDGTTDTLKETPDVVLSIATIEHQPDPKKFLTHLCNLVPKGGMLYIATPNSVHLANRLRVLLGKPILANTSDFFEHGLNFRGHWREYTLGELVQMVEKCDMTTITAMHIMGPRPHLKDLLKPRKIKVFFTRLASTLYPPWRDGIAVLAVKA